MKPGSRYEALHYGYKWYKAERRCAFGHKSMRRTSDCACKECLEWAKAKRAADRLERAESDRRKAETDKLAKRQKRHADRLRGRLTDDQVVMVRSAPDTIIDRPTARLLGWQVYRTGELCSCGGRTWRFIAGKRCINCGSL